MADSPSLNYVRLPGSGISRKGTSFISLARITCRLWLGDDHLLQVEAAGGYSESYKRFYFQDIQAIYLQKTKSWFVANTVLGTITGLFLLWALSIHDEVGKIILGIIAGVLLFFLVINVLRGATCVCHLKTAVHLEELPSLRRRRNAEKVLARLKPLIEAAQGGLSPSALTPQYDSLLANANAVPATPGQVIHMADPEEVQLYQSRVHRILFITLLTSAVLDAVHILLPGLPIVVLNTLVGAALGISVLVALVKQYQTDLKPAVRAVAWASAVYVGLSFLASYILMMVVTPAHQLDGTQWAYLKALSELKPQQTPALMAVLMASSVIAGLLGAAGLLLLRAHWREKQPAA